MKKCQNRFVVNFVVQTIINFCFPGKLYIT